MDNYLSPRLELERDIEFQSKLILYLEVTIKTFHGTYDKEYIKNTKAQLKEAKKLKAKLLKRKQFFEDLRVLLDE